MARALSLTATALAVLLLFAQVAVATDDAGNEAAAAQQHAQRAVSAVFDPAVHHTLGRHVAAAAARGFTAQQASVRSVAVNASCTSSVMMASTYMAAVNASCGADVRASLELFFMFNVSTPAARAAVDTMCSASCQAAYKAFVDAYAPCGNDGAARGFKAVTTMCQRWGGDYCAYKLRVVAARDSCSDVTSATACASNANCEWSGSSCGTRITTALLEQTCTPCYDAYISVARDIYAANIRHPGSLPEDSAEATANLRAAYSMTCGRVRGTWCFPIFAGINPLLVYGLSGFNSLPIDTIPGMLSNTCTDVGAACIRRTAQAFDTVMSTGAEIELRQCLSRARWSSAATSACYSNYKSTIALGKSAAARHNAVCSRGAGPSQNDWCMPALHRWSRLSCYSCNTTCYTLGTTLASDMGCCANHLDRMQSTRVFPSDFPPEYRAVVSFSYAERYNTSHNVTYFHVDRCSNVDNYNTTQAAAIAAASRAACPRAPAVSRELPLRGLRWSAVSGNATRRAALTAALRTDVALAAGVLVDDVVDAALAEDASQALTVASRRQAVAGTKFTFGIRADTTAAASLAASEFDTAATNGNLRVDSAAAVLADGCTGCVGSPTAAPGSTAAPPATGDFGAALSGASPSGTVTDSAAVGSGAAAAFVAAAAAVAAMALA